MKDIHGPMQWPIVVLRFRAFEPLQHHSAPNIRAYSITYFFGILFSSPVGPPSPDSSIAGSAWPECAWLVGSLYGTSVSMLAGRTFLFFEFFLVRIGGRGPRGGPVSVVNFGMLFCGVMPRHGLLCVLTLRNGSSKAIMS